MNIVDLLIILILLFGALNGYRKGLLGSLVGLCSSLIAIVVAFKSYGLLSLWFDDKFQLSYKVKLFLQEHINLPQAVSNFSLDNIHPPDLAQAVSSLDLPLQLKEHLILYLQGLDTSLQLQGYLGDIFHDFLTGIVVKGLAFLIIYLLISKGLIFISALFRQLTKDTFLQTCDQWGGLFVGLLLTVLTITIFTGVLIPLLNVSGLVGTSYTASVIKAIEEAKLIPHFIFLFSFISEKLAGFLFLK